MLRKNWTLIVPPLVGFVLSVLAIYAFGFERINFGDAADYINSAQSILNGAPHPRRGDFHPVFRAGFSRFHCARLDVFPK